MSDSTYWQERYEAVREEYRLLEKENEYLFFTLRKIKMKIGTGDVVDALVQIGDMVQRSQDSVSTVRKNNQANNMTGGYKWNLE